MAVVARLLWKNNYCLGMPMKISSFWFFSSDETKETLHMSADEWGGIAERSWRSVDIDRVAEKADPINIVQHTLIDNSHKPHHVQTFCSRMRVPRKEHSTRHHPPSKLLYTVFLFYRSEISQDIANYNICSTIHSAAVSVNGCDVSGFNFTNLPGP